METEEKKVELEKVELENIKRKKYTKYY